MAATPPTGASTPLRPDSPDRRPGGAPAADQPLPPLLALVGVVMFLGGTDMTRVTVALPRLAAALDLDAVESLWVADAYAPAAGVALLPAAVLADRLGRRRIYLAGLVLASVGAAVAATASGAVQLLIGRLGQGLGAALLIAATVAIIRVGVQGMRRRGLAYGTWAASFSIGSAAGPLLGGGILQLADWPWVFWLSLPVLTASVLVARAVLRESRNPDAPPLDAVSVLCSCGAVGLAVLGLKGLAQPTVPQPLGAAALALGALAAAAFVARQRRLIRPVVDIGLLRDPRIGASAAAILLATGLFHGTLYLLTQQHQILDGLTAMEAGVALLPLAGSAALGAGLAPLLQGRAPTAPLVVAGLAMLCAGALVTATTAGPLKLSGLLLLGLGAGAIMGVAANLLMSSAPAHRTADAGAIQETAFTVGAGGGIAALGALAIHEGHHAGAGSAAGVHGVGSDAALVLAALLGSLLAVAASLVLLSTSESFSGPRACSTTPGRSGRLRDDDRASRPPARGSRAAGRRTARPRSPDGPSASSSASPARAATPRPRAPASRRTRGRAGPRRPPGSRPTRDARRGRP